DDATTVASGDKKEGDGEEESSKPPRDKEEGKGVNEAVEEQPELVKETVGDTIDSTEEREANEVPREATIGANPAKQIEEAI
ncbi:unnamed protein product, partial [Ilex paraguariensis]